LIIEGDTSVFFEMPVVLLFVTLACIGLSHIIVDSHIADWFKEPLRQRLRPINEQVTRKEAISAWTRVWTWCGNELIFMTSCYQCTGFWIGLVANLLLDPLAKFPALDISDYPLGGLLLRSVMTGWVISFLSPLGAAAINYLDVYRGPSQ
jgi:Protein of unknown function (DUF1360)